MAATVHCPMRRLKWRGPPAPDEAQLMNERCRERQEAVESRVDNRVDLSPHVRGPSYNQRDDGLTVRIDLADHHSPCAR